MRTVVITGATSGFGKGLVEEFLKQGDRVIATGRKLTHRTEIFEKIREKYRERLIEKNLDVTEADERKALLQFIEQNGFSVDVLVNNAGYGLFTALEDANETDLRAQFEVNFFGLSFMIRDFLPQLRRSQGKIINVSSVLGFVGFPLTSLYCASKYAVEGLTESLYFELQPHGVQVCLIEPGSYQTGFGTHTQWGKIGEAFAWQTHNYQKMREKMNTGRTLNNPADVPKTIVRISKKKSLPLRVRIGKDCNGTYWLRRLLPAPLFLKTLSLFFARNINRRS